MGGCYKDTLLAFVGISRIKKHCEKWWNEAWNDLIPYNGTQSKSFVPDTPSFCDHMWSHVEIFSGTFNIRWCWSIWKSPITAHPNVSGHVWEIYCNQCEHILLSFNLTRIWIQHDLESMWFYVLELREPHRVLTQEWNLHDLKFMWIYLTLS